MGAALFLPAIAFLLWIAAPLGWVDLRPREELLGVLLHPLGRLLLSAVVPLSFFHWAHRFRYTLYDGLQLKHLNALIASICYGGATALSLAALVVLWTL
jgi:fumarate reductase subunit D